MTTFNLPPPLKVQGNLSINWKNFRQQFDVFMVASEKKTKSKAIQVAILLNVIGEEGVNIFNNFTLTKEEKDDMEKVLNEFELYCNPRKNIVFQRYTFHKRNQKDGEAFDSFLTDIQKLVQGCEFKDELDMVRDRIVLGITEASIQEKLLGIDDLKCGKAIEICRAAEMTRMQALTVQGCKSVNVIKSTVHTEKSNNQTGTKNDKFKNKISNYNHANKNYTNSRKIDCFRCGRSHELNKCPAYGKKCLKCGISNHFKAQCKVKKGISQVSRVCLENDDVLYINTVNNICI